MVVALPIISNFPLLAALPGTVAAADSLDLLLSLDANVGLSLLALAGALAASMRPGFPQLPERAYLQSPPMSRSAVIGALAGGALALFVWLITNSFFG